ncbi:MAG: ATP-binding protein, partial [Rubrivivax sp.]
GAPLAGALGVATDVAKEFSADEMSDTGTNVQHAQSAGPAAPTDTRAVLQQEGEGLGLSIVKQLCGLLDAAIELDSRAGQGTTFRVLLPRQYAS